MAFTLALIFVVVAIIVSRVLRRRSLPMLSSDQKASVMDASARGNIWPLVVFVFVLALPSGLAFVPVPPVYRLGALAAFFFAVVLLSLGASTTQIVRLSRLAMPPAYLRSLYYGTFLVHFALVLLIIVLALLARHDHIFP